MPSETNPSPTFPVRPEHVVALVSTLLQKKPDARMIGIHVTGPWAGGAEILVNGEACRVVYGASVLAVREALERHAEDGAAGRLVLLTPVPEEQLGWDVLARLARTRLLELAPWELLQDLFRARAVDPRITPHRWMAELLLERVPPEGYPPVPGGVLDADTAWSHLLSLLLDLRTGRPDAEALLEWSVAPEAAARYDRLPVEVRSAFRARIGDTAGRLGDLLVDALDAGRGRWLMPIGLVCEVLFPGGTPAGPELGRAAVRTEPYLGGTPLEAELGRRWFAAARRVLEHIGEPQALASLQQAEELLGELRAEGFAGLSTLLPAGYARRLEGFGSALSGYLRGEAAVAQVQDAFAAVAAHRYAPRQPERIERLEMALRLVRYLASPASESSSASRSFAAAAHVYAAEGSFVDWARTMLLGGEQESALASALAELYARVQLIREQQNCEFAQRLAEWSRTPGMEATILPVERILEQVAAPLAARSPLLVLLCDGMDFAIFHQLLRDLSDRGWEQWMPEGLDDPLMGVAVVPSVTGFSRTSFFSGRVTAGTAADEKRAFASHPGLVAASRSKRLPVLFHKGELTEGGTAALAEPVRDAIRDAEQRVVGLVLNAVDDHLAKSDQVRPHWTVDRIRLLDPLLYEAGLAGRVVVLASDHGHVLEAGTRMLRGGEEARWRPYAEPLAEEEIALEGPRVQAATRAPRIVAPWSEGVRYTQKRAGYHGGATLQEVLVPLAVLATWDRSIEQWKPLPERTPSWWGTPEPAPVHPAETPPPGRSVPPRAQVTLFEEPTASVAEPLGPWIAALLRSPLFAAQRTLLGRTAPPDDEVRTFLAIMDRYHGRAPRRAVAESLGQPEIRIRGLLAGLQRLLNVDGYPIVSVDEATGVVVLDRDLLWSQFEIPS
ncbi:MAG: BREX-2 system phosphatase PglZ [Longimicrobiaceae bacterium]